MLTTISAEEGSLSPRSVAIPSPDLVRDTHSPAVSRSLTPNFTLEPLRDSDDSDDSDGVAHPPQAPMIRRFTLADPLYMPET